MNIMYKIREMIQELEEEAEKIKNEPGKKLEYLAIRGRIDELVYGKRA